MARHAIADVKALLQGRLRELVAQLAPDGHWQGLTYAARNPRRDDKRRGSFVIWARAEACGAWKDFATGDKGDVIGLVQYCLGLAETKDALAWAENWLGLAQIPDADIKRARAEARERDAKAAKKAVDDAAKNASRALSWWLSASPALAGTPVETYLDVRGIPLAALARPPSALRFAARLEHRPSRSFWPGMMALMTCSARDIAVAVHRTYLAHDGAGKAPVDPARMIWPAFRGAAIRLARGETGLRPADAAKHGLLDTLAICEGVEDGLSVALACPELRVWAAGSLDNIGALTVPPCSRDVIVCADNDWGKPQALRQLDKAVAALVRQGARVRVARSPVGKDVNDALRGAA